MSDFCQVARHPPSSYSYLYYRSNAHEVEWCYPIVASTMDARGAHASVVSRLAESSRVSRVHFEDIAEDAKGEDADPKNCWVVSEQSLSSNVVL